MGFGVPEELLEAIGLRIKDLVTWSPFVYIVGMVLVALLAVEVFRMLRASMSKLGIDSSFDSAVRFGDGRRVFGLGGEIDSRLKWAGYRRVGEVPSRETWAAYDDDGQQVGDTVTREFYENIKR